MSDAARLYLNIKVALESLKAGEIVDINDLGFILISRGNSQCADVPEGKLAISVVEPRTLQECMAWIRKEGHEVELWNEVRGFLLITPKA